MTNKSVLLLYIITIVATCYLVASHNLASYNLSQGTIPQHNNLQMQNNNNNDDEDYLYMVYQHQHPNVNINTEANSKQITATLGLADEYPPIIEPTEADYEAQDFQRPARLRERMLNSAFDCPGGLCDAGYAFVRSFPRIMGSNEFPDINLDDPINEKTVDYGIGVVAFSVGLPVLFLIIFLIGWLFFCCGRGCCNCLGGRVARKRYTTKDQWVVRILLIVWAGVMLLLTFFAIASNHGISKGFSKTVDGVDEGFVFLENTSVSLQDITQPFSRRVVLINEVSAAMSELPSALHKNCFTTSDPGAPLPPNSNAYIIKQHVDTQNAIITLVNNTVDTPRFPEFVSLSNSLATAHGSLDVTDDVIQDTARWKADGDKTVDIFNNLDFTQISSNVITTMFDAAANIYAGITDVILAAEVLTDPVKSAEVSVMLDTAPHIIQTISAPYHQTDLSALISTFNQNTVPPTTCPTFKTNLNDLIATLNNVIQLNADLSNSGERLGLLGTLTKYQKVMKEERNDMLTKINYIMAILDDMQTIQYSTINTQFDTFRQSAAINKFYDSNGNIQLDVIESTAQHIDSIYRVLSTFKDAMAETGSTVTNRYDATSINDVYSTMNTALTPTIPQWATLSTTVDSLPFTTTCMADVAKSVQVGEDFFVNPPEDIAFFSPHTAMLTALAIDQTKQPTDNAPRDAASDVKTSISNTLFNVSENLKKNVQSRTQLTTTAATLNSQYQRTAQHAMNLEQLNTALQTIITSFDAIQFEDVLKYDTIQNKNDNALYFTLFTEIKPRLLIYQQALQSLQKIDDQYKTFGTEVLNVSRRQLVTGLTATRNQLGSCTGTISLDTPSIPLTTIRESLQILYTTKQSVNAPSETIVNEHVAMYNVAGTSLKNYGTEDLPTWEQIQSATAPFSAIRYDTRTVNDITQWITPPRGNSNGQLFLQTLQQNLTLPITTTQQNLATQNTKTQNVMRDLSTNLNNFVAYNQALLDISTGRVSMNDKSHRFVGGATSTLEIFPFNPFFTKPTPWIAQSIPNATPPVLATHDVLSVFITTLSQIQQKHADTVTDTLRSINSRVDSLQTSFQTIEGYLEDWSDLRTDVKRAGYVSDQERIIILDVFLSIGAIVIFCIAIFALIKFHKVTMLCTMLLCPFVVLALILALIHLPPSVLVSDVCEDVPKTVESILGERSVPSTAMAGLIAFTSTSTPQPTKYSDFYRYSALCDQTVIPQAFQVLRDARPDTIDLQTDDLTLLQEQIQEDLDNVGLTMSPRLQNVVNSLNTITIDLATAAQQLFDTIQCEKSKVVFEKVENGSCQGFVKSMAILGGLLLLMSVCIIPGLICGCLAFKRLNSRNHVSFKRKLETKDAPDGGKIVFVVGYVETKDGQTKSSEIVTIKHQEPGLEDASWAQLKGYNPSPAQQQRMNQQREEEEFRAQQEQQQLDMARY